MSTRSRIGIVHNDGSIDSIYCHFDGYYEGVGMMLEENYQDVNKVTELIKLGDISYLEKYLNPKDNGEHNFENPQEDVVVAYGRDRKMKDIEFKTDLNLSKFIDRCSGCLADYCYLYDEEKRQWMCSSYQQWDKENGFENLDNVIEKLNEIKEQNMKLGGM